LSSSSTDADDSLGLFDRSKIDVFSEENYATPKFLYRFLPGRAPLLHTGVLYGIGKMKPEVNVPSLNEVHTFIRDLFVKAHLSAECSIGIFLFHIL